MDKKKDIATLLQEAVDAMVKYGGIPHVVICNKKTWEKIAMYFGRQSRVGDNITPLQIWFKYEGGDLPILKSKYSPDDRIDVLDKENYERVMKETKGKFSFSPYYKSTAEGYCATTHIGIEALPLDEQKKARKTHSPFDKHPCELLKGKYK